MSTFPKRLPPPDSLQLVIGAGAGDALVGASNKGETPKAKPGQQLLADGGLTLKTNIVRGTAGKPQPIPLDLVGELKDDDKKEKEKRNRRLAARQRDKVRALLPAGKDLPASSRPVTILPTLPQRAAKRSAGTLISFVVCVVVPVCIAAAYWIFIASDQYVAEFRFAVRDAKAAASATPEMSVPNMAGVATSGSTLENYMVADYLASPQAVEDLQSRIGIKRLYSRSGIDWLSRFDDRAPEEKFVRYWNRRITASYDQLTGLATAKVVAFTPDDAYLIAKTLVSMAEELVNNIATRPQRDAIRFAEEELRRAEGRLKEVNARVAAFRNKEQVIDPQNNVVNSNVLLVQTLRANLAQLKTELASLKKQNLDPSAPMSLALQSRIKATKEQLAAVEAEVPNSRDGADPLSKVMGDYEQLDLERQFARDAVNSALRNLDQARFVALTQHLYVTTYVSPRLPESPAYPRRWLNIFITAFCSVLVWIVGLMLVRAIREHAA